MNDIDIVRTYYEQVVAAGFPHSGEIADDRKRLKAVSIRGCHGNSKNQLFFFVTVNAGCLSAITYECQYCDVTMYVTAELICGLVTGLPVAALAQIGDAEVAQALGGDVRKIKRQARITLGLLREGLARANRS